MKSTLLDKSSHERTMEISNIFAVPPQYEGNSKLELMLKEISYLFYQLHKTAPSAHCFLTRKGAHYRIEKETKALFDLFVVKGPGFKLSFLAGKDGLSFIRPVLFLEKLQASEDNLLRYIAERNFLSELRAAVARNKESFISLV